MTDTTRAPERDGWFTQAWHMLAAWEAAINSDPMERLQERVRVLEHQVHDLRDRAAGNHERVS